MAQPSPYTNDQQLRADEVYLQRVRHDRPNDRNWQLTVACVLAQAHSTDGIEPGELVEHT